MPNNLTITETLPDYHYPITRAALRSCFELRGLIQASKHLLTDPQPCLSSAEKDKNQVTSFHRSPARPLKIQVTSFHRSPAPPRQCGKVKIQITSFHRIPAPPLQCSKVQIQVTSFHRSPAPRRVPNSGQGCHGNFDSFQRHESSDCTFSPRQPTY